MRTVKASEFKASCLELMEEVAKNGEQVVITRRGKPISLLSAYPARPSLYGRHRNTLRIRGDVLAPVDETWESEG